VQIAFQTAANSSGATRTAGAAFVAKIIVGGFPAFENVSIVLDDVLWQLPAWRGYVAPATLRLHKFARGYSRRKDEGEEKTEDGEEESSSGPNERARTRGSGQENARTD